MKRLTLFIIMCLVMTSVVSAQDEPDEFIPFGESRLGAFTNDDPIFTMAFEGSVGDVIYITALDDPIPVEFTLFSPNGGQLAQADNAIIQNIELGVEGIYTIEFVRPDWSDAEGEFIAHLGYYQPESFNVEDEGRTLSYQGTLADAGAFQQFKVDFEEGELLTFFLYSPYSYITIQSPTDEYVYYGGAYDDPEIPLFYIPMTGTYTLTIQTLEPGGAEFDFNIFKRELIEVTANETISDELEDGLPSVFVFESVAGKMWDINAVVPQNGDGFIVLYQFTDDREPWETAIDEDWGTGPNGQPRIQPFIPSVDGVYHIGLWYDDWDTDYALYDYELTISPSTLLSIVNKSPLTGEISSETGRVQYAYRGNAGDMIRISYQKLSDEGDLALAMYSVEDEVITFTGRNTTRGNFEVELPLDGFYEFYIWNASYDEMSVLEYEILVEVLSQ
jgi:hypothetical protein